MSNFKNYKTRAVLELYPSVDVVRQDETGHCLAYSLASDSTETEISINQSDVDARAKLIELRIERDGLLRGTDYWALSDTATMTQAQTDYRQALRDITDNATSLDDVTWPTKP